MSKNKQLERAVSVEIWGSALGAIFGDSWILMLALGGLSHQLHVPRLALAYWSCVLIVIVGIAILPQGIRSAAYLRWIAERTK